MGQHPTGQSRMDGFQRLQSFSWKDIAMFSRTVGGGNYWWREPAAKRRLRAGNSLVIEPSSFGDIAPCRVDEWQMNGRLPFKRRGP